MIKEMDVQQYWEIIFYYSRIRMIFMLIWMVRFDRLTYWCFLLATYFHISNPLWTPKQWPCPVLAAFGEVTSPFILRNWGKVCKEAFSKTRIELTVRSDVGVIGVLCRHWAPDARDRGTHELFDCPKLVERDSSLTHLTY